LLCWPIRLWPVRIASRLWRHCSLFTYYKANLFMAVAIVSRLWRHCSLFTYYKANLFMAVTIASRLWRHCSLFTYYKANLFMAVPIASRLWRHCSLFPCYKHVITIETIHIGMCFIWVWSRQGIVGVWSIPRAWRHQGPNMPLMNHYVNNLRMEGIKKFFMKFSII
jgi:hypothetical protein